MKSLIKEMRRREVFRTTGLYVGISWILIEVSSVVMPTLGVPDWVFRGLITVAVAGFPVMLVLAWFFDASREGIRLQAGPNESIAENLGARKSDFVIIGVLVIALAVSLSLNLRDDAAPAPVALETVSVAIGSVRNSTEDPLLNLAVSQALTMGLEVAQHVHVYPHQVELDFGDDLGSVDVLVSGSIGQLGNTYQIALEGQRVADQKSLFAIERVVEDSDALLPAIADLAKHIRQALGDEASLPSLGLSTNSVAATILFAQARRAELAGDWDTAMAFYQQAVGADPEFGEATASLALSLFVLGHNDAAIVQWDKAKSLMTTMPARERLRAMGRYYMVGTGVPVKAAEAYAELVKQFPADIDARSRYAVAALQQRDISNAIKQTREILKSHPANRSALEALAKYLMYAGDWEAAHAAADGVIAKYPELLSAYVVLAMANFAQGRPQDAAAAYSKLAEANEAHDGASLAALGLADLDLYRGQSESARAQLESSIENDLANSRPQFAALKYLALAEHDAEIENFSAARANAARAIELSNSLGTRITAGMIAIASAEHTDAKKIAGDLMNSVGQDERAYGLMLEGMLLTQDDQWTDAILALREAVDTVDAWLIRYALGKTYLLAGNYPAALDEFTSLNARRGEASAVFLDEMPTYRLLAELPYWTGRSHEALNNEKAALTQYESYIALRPTGTPLSEDAKIRVAALAND